MFYFSGRLPLVQTAVPVKSVLSSVAPGTIESIVGWGTRMGLVVISTISRAHFTFDFHKNCKTQNLFLKYYCFVSLLGMRLFTAKTGSTIQLISSSPIFWLNKCRVHFFKFHLQHSFNYSTVQCLGAWQCKPSWWYVACFYIGVSVIILICVNLLDLIYLWTWHKVSESFERETT